MREIKFRGKRVDNGEWVYGYYFPDMLKKTHDSTVTWAFIKEYDYENAKSITQEVYKETVGQYTGLKDKNGKEVYEGDIIGNDTTYKLLVNIDKGHTCIKFKNHNTEYNEFITQREIDEEEYYILGNIHENPELLEVN